MPSALPVESRRPARGHDPVLADEVVRLLAPRPGDTVVDATFGAGGHARRLAPALGEDGRYLAIDQDPEAAAWFSDLAEDVVCETRFIRANFADALPRLADQGVRADAILMDLGLSSMQVDQPERGFSYSRQAPLDMRMDPGRDRSAADLVAEAPEAELAEIIRSYGEERYAKPIARAIVRRRREAPWSRWCGRRCRPRRCSPPDTRPSACSRPCGSRSTTSWGASSAVSRAPSTCWRRAAAWP